jgi:tetratricopeptide (TPR) repeat protein
MARAHQEHRHLKRQPRSSYLVAPPLLRGAEEVEGGPLLGELPSPVGLLLWGLYRNLSRMLGQRYSGGPTHPVSDWSLTAPAEIGSAVRILIGTGGAMSAPLGEIADACLCVASWATDRKYGHTALAYTQIAALIRTDDPAMAYRVGRMARDLSQYPRAESWLRAAVKLARGRDWETYALAYIALANLYIDVGNYPAARVLATRALRAGGRHNIPSIGGMANHALFIMAAQSGSAQEAHELAELAFTHYGPEHPRIPALAHDLACFWSDWGQFARSLPVFRAVAAFFPDPDDYVVITANLARAAAALGNRAEYESAWFEATNTLPECTNAPRIADALLTLARSAASLNDFDQAEDYAQRAHALAEERGLNQLRLEAESALEAIRAERQIVSTRRSEPPNARETGNRLAGALVRSLTTFRRPLSTSASC